MSSPYRGGDAEVRFTGQARAAFLPYLPPQRGATWWSATGPAVTYSHGRTGSEHHVRAAPSLLDRYDIERSGTTGHTLPYPLTAGVVAVAADRGHDHQGPFGNSLGVGYTGGLYAGDRRIDLAQYAGMRVLVRFGYITDDAVESIGFSISGAELTDPPTQAALPITDWESQGFRLLPTWNPPTQRFSVLLIEGTGPEDTRPLPLDARNDGHWLLPAGEIRAVMVCGMTAGALPAPYRLTIAYAEEAEPG